MHTSEALIVWTINFVGNDHCNVAYLLLDDGGAYSEIFIYCDSPPMEGSPLTLFVIDDPNSGGFAELDHHNEFTIKCLKFSYNFIIP